MKLRMYLRGLGIGIVVTALLMGFTTAGTNKISNSEIIERAEALGMVMEDNTIRSVAPKKESESVDMTEEPAVIDTQELSKPEAAEPETEPEAKPEAEPETEINGKSSEEQKNSEEEPKEEPKEEPEEEPADEKPAETAVVTTGSFTLEIAGGSGSETVSALLEKGGAVRSATEFDEYLCNNGYDHRITAGKHVIPAGADYETIAKIITSR